MSLQAREMLTAASSSERQHVRSRDPRGGHVPGARNKSPARLKTKGQQPPKSSVRVPSKRKAAPKHRQGLITSPRNPSPAFGYSTAEQAPVPPPQQQQQQQQQQQRQQRRSRGAGVGGGAGREPSREHRPALVPPLPTNALRKVASQGDSSDQSTGTNITPRSDAGSATSDTYFVHSPRSPFCSATNTPRSGVRS